MKINLHTHQKSNCENTLDIVNRYPREVHSLTSFFSIGIHPWYIAVEDWTADLATIDEQLTDLHCLALGECGLDKRIDLPMDLQIQVFERQLLLAEKHQKPVIIHCVAAFDELLSVKKRMKITVPFIIHGYSKSEQLMNQLLENHCYISFGKYLLRKPELSQVFKNVPLDRFFLETDTMEESLSLVYEKAALVKGMNLEQLESQIKQNAQSVFGFSNQLIAILK